MAPNTRKPPLRQPILNHFRTQKSGSILAGNNKPSTRASTKSISIDKGKAKAEDVEVKLDADAETKVSDPSSLPLRVSTPPPRNRNENENDQDGTAFNTFQTPRTPPRTPKPRSRTATLPDLDLLEPLQRSPVSVRTDPDTGKMFLLLSPGKGGLDNSGSTSKSKIASTPPSRRLFSDELASTQETSENHSRPFKRVKRSNFDLVREEKDENPFANSSHFAEIEIQSKPCAQSTSLKASSFIHPLYPSKSLLRGSRTLPLPTHHQTLLALHAALEHALVVHLASSGTAGSTIEETSKDLVIPQLISFSVLRPLVERSSGRRFGKNELARLLWLWGATTEIEGKDSMPSPQPNIGFTITKTQTNSKGGKRQWELMLGIRLPNNEEGQWNEEDESDVDFDDQDEYKIAKSSSTQKTPQNQIKLPMTPRSQTRALGIAAPQSPSPSPRFTRTPMGGIGVGKPITPPMSPLQSGRSTRHVRFSSSDLSSSTLSASQQLGQPDVAPSSPSSAYARRGISIVALWNNGMEQRKRIVRKRLLKWCLACLSGWRASQSGTADANNQEEKKPLHGLGILSEGQETATTSSDQASPAYTDDFVFKWDHDFPLERVAPIPMAQLPTIEPESSAPSLSSSPLSSTPRKTKLDLARDAHQTAIAQSEERLGRKLTLAERIRAKEQAAASRSSTKRAREESESTIQQSTSASSIAAIAREKSALSRLQDVAESVYMLFVSSGAGSGGGSTSQNRKFSPLPLQDVIKAVCSASKQVMGNYEAQQALYKLQTIAPGFVEIEKIGMRDWVKLLGNVKIDSTNEDQQDLIGGNGGVLATVRKLVRMKMQEIDA